MSSEESDENDDRVIVHPLLWRSDVVDKMFQKTDTCVFAKKSSQAKRQTREDRRGVFTS